MSALIGQLTEVVTALFNWVATICTTIVSQPLLLLVTGIMLCGASVGIFSRFLHRG